MRKFGNPLTTSHHRNKGKGGKQEMLPSRHAVSMLTSSPGQPMGNYAKATPSGAGAMTPDPAMTTEAQGGVSAAPDE